MQIGRQEKFHMGKIADNAEQRLTSMGNPSFICQGNAAQVLCSIVLENTTMNGFV